ncbi:hypothetical protein MRX96_013009 [Rhipicephalus microplus]
MTWLSPRVTGRRRSSRQMTRQAIQEVAFHRAPAHRAEGDFLQEPANRRHTGMRPISASSFSSSLETALGASYRARRRCYCALHHDVRSGNLSPASDCAVAVD